LNCAGNVKQALGNSAEVAPIKQLIDHTIAADPQGHPNTAVAPANAAADTAYKAAAQAYETADGSHSVGRHGPEVTDPQLLTRLNTGVAPDGANSPCPASTKFSNYEMYVKSRRAAMDAINASAGINPATNQQNGQPLPASGTLSITRTVQFQNSAVPPVAVPIDDGFRGVPPDDGAGHYANSTPVGGITGVITTVQWNPHMQRVTPAQHIPNGSTDWDNGAQNYPGGTDLTAVLL
jgi:hypothetical protein